MHPTSPQAALRRRSPPKRWLVVATTSLVVAVVLASQAMRVARAADFVHPFEYPFDDPHAASILGTPEELRADLPARIPWQRRELVVLPEREVPDVLWYARRLMYGAAVQQGPAPLMFLLAGTGASFESRSMLTLARAFHQAGFHVISLTSPTHPNFVVAASSSGAPGDVSSDVEDLYRVMQMAISDLGPRLQVTQTHITGFSLGGAHAPFLARLDDQRGRIGIGKVLLLNPPVSLYDAIVILDRMLDDRIGTDPREFQAFFDDVMDRLSAVYTEVEDLDFNDELLFKGFAKVLPEVEDRKTVIGLAFRLAAANMFFTSDVLTQGGFFVPASLRLGVTDGLADFMKVAMRTSFRTYVDEYLLPIQESREAGLTREAVIARSSLRHLDAYIDGSERFGLITNADDIVLGPGDLDFLRRVFGERASVFPIGGHGGNLAHRDVIAAVLAFFADAVEQPGALQ